jgi:hypothetical protein
MSLGEPDTLFPQPHPSSVLFMFYGLTHLQPREETHFAICVAGTAQYSSKRIRNGRRRSFFQHKKAHIGRRERL